MADLPHLPRSTWVDDLAPVIAEHPWFNHVHQIPFGSPEPPPRRRLLPHLAGGQRS